MTNTQMCQLCAQESAAYYQGIVGTHTDKSKKEDVAQVRVFVCEPCKNELERAGIAVRKRNAVLLFIWVIQLVFTVVYLSILAPLTLFISLLLLPAAVKTANWLFAPRIYKTLTATLEKLGTLSCVKFGELGEMWRALDSDAELAGCSRCCSSALTHQFEIIGLRHTTTEGVLDKKDVYATVRYTVPLCTPCADGLDRRMNIALLLKITGASILTAVVFYSVGTYMNTQWSTWLDVKEWPLIIPISIVFALAYALFITASYYLIEGPWLRGTEAYRFLSAEGYDGGVRIGGRPLRKPNCRFERIGQLEKGRD